ncbi:MAG: methyltransferase domain-containing protein [Fervidicoccaceae archaeon]
MLLARASEGSKFADIGCGDGRASIIASKYFGSKSACIEVREELCMLSYANAVYNGVADKLTIACQDAREIEYNDYDILYIYMFPSFLEEISKKLDEELREGARVLTLDFPIKGWHPILMRRVVDDSGIERSIFLYVVGISNPASWRMRAFNGYPEI